MLCFGFTFALLLLAGVYVMDVVAGRMSREMYPDPHGILTTRAGNIAGVAHVIYKDSYNLVDKRNVPFPEGSRTVKH